MIIHLIFAAALTFVLLGIWTKVGIKDTPSNRSSHVEAVPTAAGICFSFVLVVFYLFDDCFKSIPIGFILGIGVLSTLGFIDDWKEISYKIRLVGHVLSVAMVLLVHNMSPIEYFIWFFIGVGLINVCNFIDGLNGLLASQWLLTCGFLLVSFADSYSIFWVLWTCVLVYLLFNFPKAHLFMGDTGSTILGFSYFAIIFYLAPSQAEFPTIVFTKDSFILFALFPMAFAWGDVMFTLVRRFIEKRSIVNSFADYGFHYLARFFKNHSFVTLIYAGLNSILVLAGHILFLHHEFLLTIIGLYALMQAIHLLAIYKISRIQSVA